MVGGTRRALSARRVDRSPSLLRVSVAVAGLVPVGAGLAGVLLGPDMLRAGSAAIGRDSHYRYLSGLLLAIGLAFWSLIPRIGERTREVRLLTALVVTGGLARLLGLALGGVPDRAMLGALVMELAVTPLLCLWQARIAVPRRA